jgi:hypothetical protein
MSTVSQSVNPLVCLGDGQPREFGI